MEAVCLPGCLVRQAESSGRVEPPHPKRIRRDWDHEKACFLCQKNVDPKKAAKVPPTRSLTHSLACSKPPAHRLILSGVVVSVQVWVKCGWCPRVYHFTCLEVRYVKPEAHMHATNSPSFPRCLVIFCGSLFLVGRATLARRWTAPPRWSAPSTSAACASATPPRPVACSSDASTAPR